jgi:hypothetical protein
VDEAIKNAHRGIVNLTNQYCPPEEILKRKRYIFFGLIPQTFYACPKHGDGSMKDMFGSDHSVCGTCWDLAGQINHLERVQDTFKEWRALVLEAKDDGDVTFDSDDIDSLRGWVPRKEEA